ncbi:DNA primase [Jeotgalibacillus soli]|uniref:DNA primase n=1 Tax=Jeotgalibacillus soli TaxID=889306 RepID=UPI0005977026|nr:DNA primase [Jeotgalibacillus soli]
MNERIPEETVEEIRRKTDIVDIISDFVQLKKQGRNYFGLCPFHGENSPSFSVSPDKQIFHCFGCGAGGNVYTFLMDHDGVTFQEAVLQLGSRTGISVNVEPDKNNRSEQQEDISYKNHLEAHDLLAKFYHHLLLNTSEGQEALEYMYSRGFNEEQLKTFKVGWALPSWDFTAQFLKNKGFDLPSMEQAGLVIKRDDGSYFDRFRGRVMFPIENDRGQVVAFSGRIIQPTSDEPKYLNSPETPLFQKNKLLFNYHRARGSIRREQSVVLYEGFADVISSNEYVGHGIATMGTSISDQHIQMIKRLTNQVILCYDGDQAGVEASYRASKEITAKGLAVKVAVLPGKLDPDDYIQKHGGKAFRQEVIDSSVSLMAFKMRYHRFGKNLQTEDGRINYISAALKEIAFLSGAVEKELYLKQLSDEFDISLESLQAQLNDIAPRFTKTNSDLRKPAVQTAAIPQRRSMLMPAYQTAERRLLAHMMVNEDTAYTVQALLNGAILNKDEHQAILTYLLAFYESGHQADPGAFVQILPDRHLRAFATEVSMMEINPEVGKEELNDYVLEVLKYQKMLKIKEKESEEKEAERRKDYRRAAEIGMEIIKLRKALKR